MTITNYLRHLNDGRDDCKATLIAHPEIFDQLDARDARILRARLFEGRTHASIAADENISRGRIRQLEFRAMRRVRMKVPRHG